MVTATSGLPDEEQGLATGPATMSQQIGITLAIWVNAALCTTATLVVTLFLRTPKETAAAA